MTNKFIVMIMLLIMSCAVSAKDIRHLFSIEDAFNSADFQGRLNESIKLSFGTAKHAQITSNHGTFTSNRKTNSFGKSTQIACEWAFLSALISLQERAVTEGGNAVVNIHSYYKKQEMSSEQEFECHDGAFVTGVALRGMVVTLN